MLRPFGKVTVTTGGTPVRATDNLVNQVTPLSVPVQAFLVQALPSNAGVVYIFQGGANFSGDHRGDLDQCIAILPAPTDATTGPFPSASFGMPVIPSGLNLADIWIDVGSNGDGVLISATVG